MVICIRKLPSLKCCFGQYITKQTAYFMKQYIFIFVNIIFSLSTAAQLSIQSGATLYLGSNALIGLQDINLVNNGIITVAPNSRFSFTGTTNSEISGSQQPAFNELEIAKTGTNKLLLQRAIDVNGKIVFTSGLIDLNNNNINLGNTAFLENENENSRVIGANGGQLIFVTTLNAPASANPANLGAVITSSQDLGAVTIRRGHQSQINGYGNGNSVLRFYDINSFRNSGLNATLRFSYYDAELNNMDEFGLVLWKSINNTTWTQQGFASRNTTTNYVELTDIASFSRWTLSSPSNPLPVTGLVLSGRWRNSASYLSWTTLAEYNNDYFEVERKYTNENNFVPVGKKYSAHTDGHAQTHTAYNWIDATAVANRGALQYRLKQFDRNGQFKYSNSIVIKPDADAVFIETIYPTKVVENSLYIQTGNINAKDMQVQLFDMQGRIYLNKQLNYQSQWLPLPQLTSGMYRLIILSGEWRFNKNFIK